MCANVPIRVAFVLELYLLVVKSFLFLPEIFLSLLVPFILFSFQPFLQSCIVKVFLLFLIILSLYTIVHIMILIKALAFCINANLPLTAREDCSGGLKMRVPAVWNLDWKPTNSNILYHGRLFFGVRPTLCPRCGWCVGWKLRYCSTFRLQL